jgi:glyoxylase-like metal-dependent hydrolase (beta-lactamase superfamily II)/ferredoxin
MADAQRSYADNVPGGFFVDTACIDCDTCRQVAPLTFAEAGGHARVQAQPAGADEHRAALRAALCCPVNAIGTPDPAGMRAAVGDFPQPVAVPAAPAVQAWYCGFNAESSFGGNSYLVRAGDGGLWMVDAPRWQPALATAIAGLGGLAGIFLTHRDDIADAARYAARFHAPRVIHRRDADACPGAERVLDGDEDVLLAPGLVAIPTPGHTAGHTALLAHGAVLFSGDHLWWSRRRRGLGASRAVCWYSWPQQVASLRKLLDRGFSAVLPGHGQRFVSDAESMRMALEALLVAIAAEEDTDPDD